jgi:hypothetical protein
MRSPLRRVRCFVMPRLPFRIAMFLSSYAPLFALLAYANRACATSWHVLAAVAVASVIGLAVVMVARRNDRGPRLIVAHSRPKDGDVLAYTATYLLPFLGLDLSRSNDIALLSGFLVVLGVVYINSNIGGSAPRSYTRSAPRAAS